MDAAYPTIHCVIVDDHVLLLDLLVVDRKLPSGDGTDIVSDAVFDRNAAESGGGMSLDLATPQVGAVTLVGNSTSRGCGIEVGLWRWHPARGE